MNLVKTFDGKRIQDVEEAINNFLNTYDGELIQFQIIKDNGLDIYEAIISYKQSNPSEKQLTV